MYQKLRNLHLSTGLLSLVFLLAYAISGVEFAHRTWMQHPRHSTVEKRHFAAGISDARILAREWRGELTSIESPNGIESPAGSLKFFVKTPLGLTHEINYSISTGDATVMTTTIGFATRLLFVHLSHGVWAYVAGLVSIGLLVLGVTGIYLWFKNHKERWFGVALLAGGAGMSVALIISMRQG